MVTQKIKECEMDSKNKLDGTATSGVIKAVFFSIVIIVSMFATYGFAVTFTPDFAPDFFGAYRSVVSGILMVFMLDGAALAWQYLRLNESKSMKQIEIAEEMSQVTIGAAIIITVAYLLLTNYGLVTDAVIIAYAGYIGMAVVIAVFGYSFYRVWSFFDADPRATKKKDLIDMMADFTAQTQQAIREQLEERRSGMVDEVVQDVIDATEQDLKDVMRGYRRGNDGSKPTKPSPSSAPPAPLVENGDNFYVAYADGRGWRRTGGYRPLADAKEALEEFAASDPDMVWAVLDVDGNVRFKIEPSAASPNGSRPD
jgi:hypothetical protein